jgi:hypothetical protein
MQAASQSWRRKAPPVHEKSPKAFVPQKTSGASVPRQPKLASAAAHAPPSSAVSISESAAMLRAVGSTES